MDLLISGATVLTMDADLRVLPDAFVGITGGKISFLGKAAPVEKPKKIMDATGLVLMPGLIDAHCHLTHAILRNYRDDLPKLERLETQLLPKLDRMDRRIAAAAATLSIAEALRSGITSLSVLDRFCGPIAQVAADSGIKCNLAPAAEWYEEEFDLDEDLPGQQLQELHRRWAGFDGGRLQIEAGIHSEYTSGYQLWEALGRYAAQEALGLQLHLGQTAAECDRCLDRYGMPPAQLLNCHGLFGKRVAAAGGGALTPEGRQCLARHGATIVYTPVAALRQAQPLPDIPALLQCGLNVALGSDGPIYGGTIDLFAQMRAAALASEHAGHALPPAALLTMATICGARAQGREASCGQIRPGMDADLILLDFTAPHLIPCHDLLSALVHNASGQDVCLTMVRGKVVYAGGKFPTLDLASAVNELTQYGIETMFSEPAQQPAAADEPKGAEQ